MNPTQELAPWLVAEYWLTAALLVVATYLFTRAHIERRPWWRDRLALALGILSVAALVSTTVRLLAGVAPVSTVERIINVPAALFAAVLVATEVIARLRRR